jgi:Cellulase (glycosyl hydrolase family 5)
MKTRAPLPRHGSIEVHRRGLLGGGALSPLLASASGQARRAAAGPMGPLAAVAGRRYFVRPDGRAVYLAGSHTWSNLQDNGTREPPEPFDHAAYLRLLEAHGHTFVRLWASEASGTGAVAFEVVDPLPYERTGPGLDALGRPRFDLGRFNQAYFDRLRGRVRAAGARGIYVGIMLWNGWSVHNYTGDPAKDPWPANPYNARNNVNGIDGDPRGTGGGRAVQTLAAPAVTALQEAYLRKVVDTVNDLDNVLYEVANEPLGDAPTAAWQHHMIGYLKGYQATKPQQHPVGMTGGFLPDADTINGQLLASGADWISLAGRVPQDRIEPPAAPAGGKISLLDTDHIFGAGGDALWVWKAFVRGHNVLYMDPLDGLGVAGVPPMPADIAGRTAELDSGRLGLRGTLAAAALVGDMARMAPRGELSSSGYALADAGTAYVALAIDGAVSLDLSAANGRRLAARWIGVETAAVQDGGAVEGGSPSQRFAPPLAPPAALVLTASADR